MLSTWPVCWMRQAMAAPKPNARAATMPPAQCQPRSRNQATSAAMPARIETRTAVSTARSEGWPVTAASARKTGEKISACGSAICGKPLKMKGFQAGLSPAPRLWARNWICGMNVALASQGMVNRPDSHGQPSTSQHRPSAASTGSSGQPAPVSRSSAMVSNQRALCIVVLLSEKPETTFSGSTLGFSLRTNTAPRTGPRCTRARASLSHRGAGAKSVTVVGCV